VALQQLLQLAAQLLRLVLHSSSHSSTQPNLQCL
jgi:hypothetical protein